MAISYQRRHEERTLFNAQKILERRFLRDSAPITNPSDAAQYLHMKLAPEDRECFVALFLDAGNRVLACEELFRGTINGVVVHPREVARAALRHNAAAVLCAHNHPSGNPAPSDNDLHITDRLRWALDLLDIKLVDHLVIGGAAWASIGEYERGRVKAAIKTLPRKKRRKRSW